MLFLKGQMSLRGGAVVNPDCNSEAQSGPHVWMDLLEFVC